MLKLTKKKKEDQNIQKRGFCKGSGLCYVIPHRRCFFGKLKSMAKLINNTKFFSHGALDIKIKEDVQTFKVNDHRLKHYHLGKNVRTT